VTEPEILLESERGDGVAVLTLNRPQQRNALSAELRRRLASTLARLEEDPRVGAVVLTGAGEVFCAGFDLKELQGGDAAHVFADAQAYHHRVYTFGKPLVAAVNGAALAGGMDLAAMCDVRLAVAGATFGQPQVRLGIPAAYDLMRTVVDEATTRLLCLTGRQLGADDARLRGFIAAVYPERDTLLKEALAIAADAAKAKGSAAIKRRCIEAQPALFGG